MNQTNKRRTWLTLLGALTAALIAAVAVLLLSQGNDPDTTEPGRPTPSPDTASSTAPSRQGCEKFEASPTAVPNTAPAAIWIRRGFVDIPTSALKNSESVNGPGVLEADQPLSCFAHTPMGALFAAVAAGADGLYPPTLADWAREQVAGPGRAAAIRAADAVSPAATSDGRSIALTGFRVVECGSADRCVFELASTVTLPDGTKSTSAGATTMVWVDGDWRYYTNGSTPAPRSIDIDELEREGFIRWEH